ncbi:MAG: hypothetical protein ACN4GT_05270 [Gammaproteobacteria bacterium]
MNSAERNATAARSDRGTSPPGVYAGLFIGVTGLIGFFTLIVAVAFA